MGLQDRVEKMQARQGYRNLWHSDLMGTVTADTPYCCFACFCGPCVSYLLRKRALYNDMSRYKCCGGYTPCSGRVGERKCPELCLCTEVCFCFATSVSSTRFLIQDEFNIQTTKCDNCMIGFMVCLNQFACIFSLIACLTGSDELKEISNVLSCIAEMVFASVCACMQTQHKIELDKRDGKLGPLGPHPVMAVPPMQQMSRMGKPVSPYAGYHQQPVYPHHPPARGPHQPVGYMPPPAYGQPIYHPGLPPPVFHPESGVYFQGAGVYPPPPPGYVPKSSAGVYSQDSGDSGAHYPPVAPPPPPGYVPESPSAPPYPPGPLPASPAETYPAPPPPKRSFPDPPK